MDILQIKEHLYVSAKKLAEDMGMDLSLFTINDQFVDIVWEGCDKDGLRMRMDRTINTDPIEKMHDPMLGIDEEIFICGEIIKKVLNNDY